MGGGVTTSDEEEDSEGVVRAATPVGWVVIIDLYLKLFGII